MRGKATAAGPDLQRHDVDGQAEQGGQQAEEDDAHPGERVTGRRFRSTARSGCRGPCPPRPRARRAPATRPAGRGPRRGRGVRRPCGRRCRERRRSPSAPGGEVVPPPGVGGRGRALPPPAFLRSQSSAGRTSVGSPPAGAPRRHRRGAVASVVGLGAAIDSIGPGAGLYTAPISGSNRDRSGGAEPSPQVRASRRRREVVREGAVTADGIAGGRRGRGGGEVEAVRTHSAPAGRRPWRRTAA